MSLRRAERKVQLRNFFCVKKFWIVNGEGVGKGRCVTPSVSNLTAPSEKEPDKALSGLRTVLLSRRRQPYDPLSLASLDSSPSGRAKKVVCLLRDYFKGEPRKSTCLALLERCYSPHRGNVCEADKRVWARYEPYKFRRNFRRGFTPSVSKLTAPSEKELDIALSVLLWIFCLFLSRYFLR